MGDVVGDVVEDGGGRCKLARGGEGRKNGVEWLWEGVGRVSGKGTGCEDVGSWVGGEGRA